MDSINYFGGVLISRDLPATSYEIFLLGGTHCSENSVFVGDLVVVEDPENPLKPRFLVEIESVETYAFFEKRFAAVLKEIKKVSSLPAQLDSYTVYKAKIIKIIQDGKVFEPGIPPTPGMKWRKPLKNEVETFLRIDFDGVPVALAKSTCDIQRDVDNKVIFACHAAVLPFYIELIAGQPGSGKTVTIGLLAWYYTQRYKDPAINRPAAFVCVNNKSIDLLYLDCPAAYVDPLWKDLGIQAEGIRDFQIIYPSTDEPSRSSGCRQIPFTFDSLFTDPETLLGIVDLTDKAQLQLPDIFRFWQEQNKARSLAHFEDFIEYLQSGGQSAGNRRIFIAKSRKGREYRIAMHEATIAATVANLGTITDFFDDEEGVMINARDIVVPGRCTVIDVSGDATGKFQNLVIRQLLLSVLEQQRKLRKERKPLCPVIFAVDEAHLIYSSKYGDYVAKEISVIAKTGRTLKCGLILASQLVSDISSDILRLAQSKIIFRTEQREARALGLSSKAQVLENLQPGFAFFQDNIKLRKQLLVKIPMAPCSVCGE